MAPAVTLMLISVNVAMFVFQNAAASGAFPVYKEFALSVDGLSTAISAVDYVPIFTLPLSDGGYFICWGICL